MVTENQKKEKARERATVILRVRSGQITATQGAEMLGVSRKTYYEWEQRGLEGLMQSLESEEVGRPPNAVDPEKEAMAHKIQELEKKVAQAEQSETVRALFKAMREKEERVKKKASRDRRDPRKGGNNEKPDGIIL